MSSPRTADDPKPRIDTMENLAVAIGVSRPTLSRYFQDPDRVSRTSRARIEKGLERVDYIPNFFATRMNRKTTGMIGVIIPYLNDLFFSKLLEAVERAAMEAGFTVITQCSHADPVIEARAAETFLSMNVDGALVCPLGNQSDLNAQARLRAHLPVVLFDSRPEGMSDIDFVGTDHLQSTGLATDYLCRVGAPPVFLAMPRVNFNAMARERSYIAKMAELGHAPHVIGTQIVEPGSLYEAHGEAVLDALFARGEMTDRSILCVNDRVAIGALRAAATHGLQPGSRRNGGLRIMGHDDYPLCPYTVPSLTTVAQDVDAIGRQAVMKVVAAIRGEKPPIPQSVTLFDGVLKVRESA